MLRKAAVYFRLVMFSHTLFSLPYAACALLLLRPALHRCVLILLALLSARTFANAVNRMVDLRFDRQNPRTADRPLCTGEAAMWDTFIFSCFCAGVLLFSTWLIRFQLVLLLPAVGFLFVFYALTKRFTACCHFVLGAVCSLSVAGVCLACDSPVHWGLTAACALSVAGFDILYAIEDIDFDRCFALCSVPVLFGPRVSVWIAAVCFLGSAGFMGTVFKTAGICVYAVFCTAVFLAFSGRYKAAAYRMNQLAGVIITLLFGIHCIVS